MKNLMCFKATAIRADDSRHVLRAMFQGFDALSLSQFVAVAAPAYLLAGIGSNPIVGA